MALSPITDSVRARMEIPEDIDGLVVRQAAPDGPAAEAGVERGNVLTAINGQLTTNIESTRAALANLQSGDVVTLAMYSDGALVDVAVTLGEARERAHQQGRQRTPQWLSHVQQLMGAYPNLLDGELRVVNGEGEAVMFNVTPGQVGTVGEDTLTLERKDASEASFTLTEDSSVLKNGKHVELDTLKEGARVVVLEQDGEVKAVIAGQIRNRQRGPQVNAKRIDASFLPPEVRERLEGLEGEIKERFENQANGLPGRKHRVEGLERHMRGLHERLGQLEQSGGADPASSTTGDQQA
jgi:hypothetical protein